MHSKKKKGFVVFLLLVAFSFIVHLLCAGLFYQKIDTLNFHLPWAVGMNDGLFCAYSHIDSLNYPPLFPALLATLSSALTWFSQNAVWPAVMLLLKIYPVLFDIGLGIAVYMIMRKQNETFALICSALWLFNPATLFSSSFWGQTDSLLLLFLFFTFFMMYRKNMVLAAVFFALGCLCKLQMLYLLPIVFCELLFFYPPKKWVLPLCSGLCVFILGWLPFMIGSCNWKLPFDIYFGGFSQYQYINLFAANLYGVMPWLNWQDGNSFAFGEISWNQISLVLLFLFVAFVFLFWLWMKKTKNRVEAMIPAMLYLNLIFLFTTKMHERYQLPVVLLAFLCFITYRLLRYFILFLLLELITLTNQAIVVLYENYHGVFSQIIEPTQQILSICNLALLVFMVLAVATHLYQRTQKLSLR